LAELEKMRLLGGIVTQNIDGLHQKAGSQKVVEFHGNAGQLICLKGCGRWPADDFRSLKQSGTIPRCPECDTILKPDVVFFGEPIPPGALTHSFELVQNCNVMLVVGTSATVAPASNLPLLARQTGAEVLEFNLEPTVLSPLVTQSIIGSASETLTKLVEATRELQSG
jgi:NAD-dependent deacetylase